MIPRVLDLVRAGALGGALLLALLSKGDVLVLGLLLAVVVARPLPIVAVLGALAAAAVRWRSLALVDIAGGQAVLGSAGLVGPPAAAASAWLGAVALVAATRRRDDSRPLAEAALVAVALGASAAVVVAGAAPGGAVWQRVLATMVATGLAAVVEMARRRDGRERLLDGLSLAAGSSACVLAVLAATSTDQGIHVRFDGTTFAEGVAIALAGATIVVVLTLLSGALGKRPA